MKTGVILSGKSCNSVQGTLESTIFQTDFIFKLTLDGHNCYLIKIDND